MINLTVITVGKLKETYLSDGCQEYLKRLGAFCKASVVEVSESRLSENPSQKEIENGLAEEGEGILAKTPSGAFVIAMCIEGKMLSSPELAGRIEKAAVDGKSSIALIIGGSFGLAEKVKETAALRLSMSPMTFPHQLARLMVLEQAYRAFSILGHSKYHK